MVSRDALNAKRDLARQRHRAATKKISRLKGMGVVLSGTELDPRKNLMSFKRMNTIQLDAHIKRLDKFVSRETSYVSGTGNTPLNGALWKKHEKMVSLLNKKNVTDYEKVKNIFMPSLGMTVNEFQGMKPTHPVTGNPASRAPHTPITRSSKGVPGDKQLRALIKDLKAKLQVEHSDTTLKRDRKTLNKFLRDIGKISGVKDISKGVKDMSTKEFSFMWSYTNFATIASFDYEIAKSKLLDPKSLSHFDDAFDTQLREMRKIIKEVKTFDL